MTEQQSTQTVRAAKATTDTDLIITDVTQFVGASLRALAAPAVEPELAPEDTPVVSDEVTEEPTPESPTQDETPDEPAPAEDSAPATDEGDALNLAILAELARAAILPEVIERVRLQAAERAASGRVQLAPHWRHSPEPQACDVTFNGHLFYAYKPKTAGYWSLFEWSETEGDWAVAISPLAATSRGAYDAAQATLRERFAPEIAERKAARDAARKATAKSTEAAPPAPRYAVEQRGNVYVVLDAKELGDDQTAKIVFRNPSERAVTNRADKLNQATAE